ncbi:Anti-sigma F factor antagonist (spoIIAA-2); Anti-sigma B factor antagonist RsbV [hydrothermal vent metagenome]|uniref:Anti-sigma F factor antagonist (SpoIIAA-2) Anti-sigma B factor antagonist RsbV n=1 Tax=hydrothermal vent metagenome TaxID=652676 RepID=A0A3B1AP35_9ZZZZ
MSVKTTVSPDGNEITLHISGRFDFSTHQGFVSGYKEHPKGEKSFIVDLSAADYMDSSAMGMLLQLREYGKGGGVKLVNANDGILEILRIANFDKLFSIA